MAATMRAGVLNAWDGLAARLRAGGEVLPLLVLRPVMGWEFWESGLEKLHGENWSAGTSRALPFSTWCRATCPGYRHLVRADRRPDAVWVWAPGFSPQPALPHLLSLPRRVHWPTMLGMWTDLFKGYAITDMGRNGNFACRCCSRVMLLPLIFTGAGKLSLDHLAARLLRTEGSRERDRRRHAWAPLLAVLGLPS